MEAKTATKPGGEIHRATAKPTRQDRLSEALDLSIRKTRRNIKLLADDPEPSTWSFDKDGHYPRWKENFFLISNWTTSFITGMALVALKKTRDEYFHAQVCRLAPLYRLKVYEHDMGTMHDLGFLYSLYSVALYKLTGDKAHRETGLRAAEVLAGRFVANGGYIRAWGRMDELDTDYAGLAIIDCMMNLPLLYWASKESGNSAYRDAAVRHADTTLKLFIRPDDSVCHAYRFNPQTGHPAGAANYCGHDVNTQWARGTAWAIYGFALSYSYTREARYLESALRLARKFISQLDAEGVPVWDFRLPAGAQRLRDSSAASIAICGFQELQKHNAAEDSMLEAKKMLLDRLCSRDYLDASDATNGLLKDGQIGGPLNAYCSWGDYFFMEALAREQRLDPGFW